MCVCACLCVCARGGWGATPQMWGLPGVGPRRLSPTQQSAQLQAKPECAARSGSVLPGVQRPIATPRERCHPSVISPEIIVAVEHRAGVAYYLCADALCMARVSQRGSCLGDPGRAEEAQLLFQTLIKSLCIHILAWTTRELALPSGLHVNTCVCACVLVC